MAPSQSGISRSVEGVIVALRWLVPAPTANTIVRLPPSAKEREHCCRRILRSEICTAVSWNKPVESRGGTSTTTELPTGTLSVGIGVIALSVMVGALDVVRQLDGTTERWGDPKPMWTAEHPQARKATLPTRRGTTIRRS
jgi:hypothetical protein